MQSVQDAVLVDGLGLAGDGEMSQNMHTVMSDFLQVSAFGAIFSDSLLYVSTSIEESIQQACETMCWWKCRAPLAFPVASALPY